MKQQEYLGSITKYFSRFREQINLQNKNGEFSINIHSENVLIKILDIIFNLNFENLNYVEGKNYNSIDLGDKNGKMAIQVTATSGIEKIKDTLKAYVGNGHYKKYKELKILILTTRQEKYSQEAINKVTGPNYQFNEGRDIIDFTSLYVLLNKQNDLCKILAVKELLESQFSDTIVKFEEPAINSFKQLCEAILPSLKENESIFKRFGPNSGADVTEPLRWDLTLWYKARRERILPNNTNVSDLITAHQSLVPKEYIGVFEDFLAHSYAFEKHCEDANFDYSRYLFPKEIMKIVNEKGKK